MNKAVMMVVAALSAFALFAGNTCTWTGQAGDGNWATPGNWEDNVKPVSGNGDRVILSNTGNSAVISNGLGTISIDGLTIAAGSQAFKLVGDAIQLESVATVATVGPSESALEKIAIYDKTSGGEIEIATPLVLPTGLHYFRIVSNAALHLSGVISGKGGFDYQSTSTAWQSKTWKETDRLKISGDNTFEGTVYLRNYCTDIVTTNALGKAGKSVYLGQNYYSKYKFSAAGHYAYVFRASNSDSWCYFMADAELDKLEFYQTGSAFETALTEKGLFPYPSSRGFTLRPESRSPTATSWRCPSRRAAPCMSMRNSAREKCISGTMIRNARIMSAAGCTSIATMSRTGRSTCRRAASRSIRRVS